MVTWTAGNEGQTIGEYASRRAMFDDLTDRLGIGAQFCAMSSEGAFYVYEITRYGFRVTENNVPAADGRRAIAVAGSFIPTATG